MRIGARSPPARSRAACSSGSSGYEGGVCKADSSRPARARMPRTASRWNDSAEWLAATTASSAPCRGSPARIMPRPAGACSPSAGRSRSPGRPTTTAPRPSGRPARPRRGAGSRPAPSARPRPERPCRHPRRTGRQEMLPRSVGQPGAARQGGVQSAPTNATAAPAANAHGMPCGPATSPSAIGPKPKPRSMNALAVPAAAPRSDGVRGGEDRAEERRGRERHPDRHDDDAEQQAQRAPASSAAIRSPAPIATSEAAPSGRDGRRSGHLGEHDAAHDDDRSRRPAARGSCWPSRSPPSAGRRRRGSRRSPRGT